MTRPRRRKTTRARSPTTPLVTKRRKWHLAIGAVSLPVLAAAFVAVFAWRSPPYYQPDESSNPTRAILSSAEYDAARETHARPYEYTQTLTPGSARVVGAEHSKDPRSVSVAAVRRAFDEFRPTVVLIEGRLGFHLGGIDSGVRRFAEPAAAYALARRGNVRVFTWEPARDEEVRRMLDRFPKERVALFFVLRPYFSNLRHGRPADPDNALEKIRATRTRWAGLEGTLPSVASIDEIWRRDFAGLADWRDTSDQHGWPGPLAELAEWNRDLRTNHLARCVIDLTRKGERVLVVCGSSHAVRLRPALGP